MPSIEFSNQEKAVLVEKLQRYFDNELDQELGQFDAEFLLDFIAKEIGVYFYNRGLYDAQAVLDHKFDELKDAIEQIEQPTTWVR
ncbi:DUF2164 domain-containing protein [Photobacterium sp. TY1-4]|uniref:DUF2164 domain-containing protein n=1 Tax=Photobacterium sp. TY1-4 TaxID=2899122 RepID=UPI0021C0C0A2|nr:DUF2164 domain-containing protein [Photobacterium sp. TY1-4]UXI03313.1 DUF2164 domain-containing protein [Photobacterium sp. TY1-4]